jgi:hypothetical protein
MKTLILHGSFGSPNENWFRWLESSLKALGHDAILEQFPVDNYSTVDEIGESNIHSYQPIQTLASWEKYFIDTIIPKINGEEINVVAHSIAPVFMLHILEKYDLKIKKAIFVAPFFDLGADEWHFYVVNKTFYKTNFNVDKIRSQIKQSFVVYGDNDPYVPASQSILFAKKLGSSVTIIPNGGHCGSIFKEFPTVLDFLK